MHQGFYFNRFTVTARDSATEPLFATALLTLNVIDVNDNPPELPKTLPEIFVKENVNGVNVATIKVNEL